MAKVRTGSIDPDARIMKTGNMLRPEQLAKSGTEHAHQTAILQWTILDGSDIPDLDMLFAIPNGGDRSPSVAASLKAEGVKPGVPDLCWPVPRGMFAGLYVELKTPKHFGTKSGGRSDKQIDWHKRLRAKRYAVITAYGWQAATWAIRRYYNELVVMPEGDDCEMYGPTDVPA